jgi:hypothetical protein
VCFASAIDAVVAALSFFYFFFLTFFLFFSIFPGSFSLFAVCCARQRMRDTLRALGRCLMLSFDTFSRGCARAATAGCGRRTVAFSLVFFYFFFFFFSIFSGSCSLFAARRAHQCMSDASCALGCCLFLSICAVSRGCARAAVAGCVRRTAVFFFLFFSFSSFLFLFFLFSLLYLLV